MIDKMKKLFAWVGIDGLLHILTCYAMMLALTPIIGFGIASYVTALAAALKEAYDYFVQKDNDVIAVGHDFACDGIGYILACLTILIHYFL